MSGADFRDFCDTFVALSFVSLVAAVVWVILGGFTPTSRAVLATCVILFAVGRGLSWWGR